MSRSKADALRLAWLTGSTTEFILEFETYKQANAMRLRMYTYARKFRKAPKEDSEEGKVFDWELHDALQVAECVTREVDGKWQMVCRPDWQNEIVLKIYKAAGFDAATGREAEALASERRMAQRMASGEMDYDEPVTQSSRQPMQYDLSKRSQAEIDEANYIPPTPDELYGED